MAATNFNLFEKLTVASHALSPCPIVSLLRSYHTDVPGFKSSQLFLLLLRGAAATVTRILQPLLCTPVWSILGNCAYPITWDVHQRSLTGLYLVGKIET